MLLFLPLMDMGTLYQLAKTTHFAAWFQKYCETKKGSKPGEISPENSAAPEAFGCSGR